MNMRKLVLGLSFAAGISVAQVDPSGMENLSLADLMNIKLQTGSFLELDLSKSPLSMTLIKKDQISLSGSRNLSELLEIYVPGFAYTFNKWNGVQWGMRGVSNDRNTKFIVLVNGHKINTESKDGFISETTLGLLGDIERVEVLRGPAGLVYGSGAIAGIVNVVTRKVDKPATEVEVALGSYGDMRNTSKQVDIRSYSKPAPDHELVATLGYRQDDGMGSNRLYGFHSWPSNAQQHAGAWGSDGSFTTDWIKTHGSPSNGSYGATPGDYRASVDWSWNKLRVYGRYTHQSFDRRALFSKVLWPNFEGPTDQSWGGTPPLNQTRDSISAQISALNSNYKAQRDADLTSILKASTTAEDSATALSAINAKYATQDSALVRLTVALNNIQGQLAKLPCVKVDGRDICPTDSFWDWANGDWGNARNISIADNFTLSAEYELPLGDNSLKFNAAWDGATNRTTTVALSDADIYKRNDWGTSNVSSFGERRYTLGAMMLWKTLPKTQLATGVQERIDVFGEDLQGYNMVGGNPKRPSTSTVIYNNLALFGEGFTDVSEQLGVAYGARWDGHTRTLDFGGTWNGKLALVATPVTGHTIKLIAQTSTNNGTVDNYEHNSTQFDEKGKEHNGPELNNPTDTTSGVTNYVTTDELHKLKPERIYSFELVSTHDLALPGSGRLFLSPSASYNIVQDMFAWAQPLLRVVNSGEYHHLDMDFEARVDYPMITIGANHAIQMPVNTDPDDLYDTITGPSHYTYVATGKNAEGMTTYAPVADSFNNKTAINPVKDQITRDGNSFYGVPTHMTKAWVDVRPFTWMTIHGDVRMFWGLDGRDSTYSKLRDSTGFNFWDVNNTPIVKLNAGIALAMPSDVKVSFNVYNILGEDNGDGNSALTINTLRWGQGMDNGLYAVDVRSYALKIEKAF